MQPNLILVEHNPAWKDQYDEEVFVLKNILKELLLETHHIGSTAIPGLVAKPIIDILGVVKDMKLVDATKELFDRHGYEWRGEHGVSGRRYIIKPNRNDPSEFLLDRLVHIHLYQENSPDIQRHIAFRDYLLQHPELVEEYNALKKELLNQSQDKIFYRSGKKKFIQFIEELLNSKNL